MWSLQNDTPFAAERTWVRDENGAEVWIVALKASFRIGNDGKQVLCAEQDKVSRIPKFRGAPERTSLLCESDLIHRKLRTDVLVDGCAYSPGGKPAERVDVRIMVANIDKSLRVCGNRLIRASIGGLRLSSPEPFTSIPIVYERAFGGTDKKDANPQMHRWEPHNPVGVGFAIRNEHIIGTPAPNIEDPHAPYKNCDKGKPAGLGPIARHWLPRVTLAGTYDGNWDVTRKPLFPTDFDERFYQCAPEDQQADRFLTGGEKVELHNLTPDGYLSFHLPRVSFGMTTRFYDGTAVQQRVVLHTVILRPSDRIFQMVWHSQLPCHHKVNKLAATQILLKRRTNVASAELRTGMWIGE
jgi:hypothetical protein